MAEVATGHSFNVELWLELKEKFSEVAAQPFFKRLGLALSRDLPSDRRQKSRR